jgi:DNA-binding GntR family transcriptional regulator
VDVPDLADPRPPYLQIAGDLRRRIDGGEVKPGDKLPSNKALAARYRSSTETVRRALRVLADEGLIRAHSTLGTYVLRREAGGSTTPGDRLAALEQRVDELECQLADTRAAAGLEQWQPAEQAEARR